jgi:hypothetical protein
MYLRLKFLSGSYHFNTVVNSRSIADWISRALNGTTAISALPTSLFDVPNCQLIGSLPPKVTVNFLSAGGAGTTIIGNTYLEFVKRHNQNDNFSSLLRIYQQSVYNVGFQPRYFSSNATNMQPNAVNDGLFWHGGTSSNYMTHGVSDTEFQFFISNHWIIWTTIDSQGRGGSAGLFDVESTGQDTWASTLNSLYSPQFYISAHGALWPKSATLRVTEAQAERTQVGIYSNLMYNGDAGFTNRGTINYGLFAMTRGTPLPQIHPDPTATIFSTRNNIGDTQNYMIPVYFHTGSHLSDNIPSNRALLTGRVPFLWRTSDNAAQTGQKATVGGVEYRFVRIHPCGQAAAGPINAATYMVPTTIGGI